MKKIVLLFLSLFITSIGLKAQRVGVVLSGGGAKGLAHVGVLKALEEHNIPIDYITGTSMGGIIGGLYAAGYSPDEIEHIVTSDDFQRWATGQIASEHKYYYNRTPRNPSTIGPVKMNIDSTSSQLNANIINDTPLNFAMVEIFSQASLASKENFDSLFVPFRCVVADVFSQKSVNVQSGSLAEAIRGTMSVPLVFRPTKVEGKYVYDGGLYNNFPIDVMKESFAPEYIIGVNVSNKIYKEYPKDKAEKLINNPWMYLFLSKADLEAIGKNGTLVQPDIKDYGATDFEAVKDLIAAGYDAAIIQIKKIKSDINRKTSPIVLKAARRRFIKKAKPIVFERIDVKGLSGGKKRYVENFFHNTGRELTLLEVKKLYYKLISDEVFENVFPRMIYNPEEKAYDFELTVKEQKILQGEAGINVNILPITGFYILGQYSYLNNMLYNLTGSASLGKFNTSFQTLLRVDVPSRNPFFWGWDITLNQWTYFDPQTLSTVSSDYMKQQDFRALFLLGFPFGKNGIARTRIGYIKNEDAYSPNGNYNSQYSFDKSTFTGLTGKLDFDKSTLNKKEYPTKGYGLTMNASYYLGDYLYTLGTYGSNDSKYIDTYNYLKNKYAGEKAVVAAWYNLKVRYEGYLATKDLSNSIGIVAEANHGNKPILSTYYATVLSAPTFRPTLYSLVSFMPSLASNNYAAAGLVYHVVPFSEKKEIESRLEAYWFQPLSLYQRTRVDEVKDFTDVTDNFSKKGTGVTEYKDFSKIGSFVISQTFIYKLPFLGHGTVSVNYFSAEKNAFTYMAGLGFTIYNKRSLE